MWVIICTKKLGWYSVNSVLNISFSWNYQTQASELQETLDMVDQSL